MMTDKEKLEKALHLLREWMYELSGADIEPPDHWTTDSIGHFANLKRDYDRMRHNTQLFLEQDCEIDLEAECDEAYA